MFEALAVWDDTAARSPARQMALDEALLHDAQVPVLRTYRWSQPALTFGYPQRWESVQQVAGERTAIRRWTGGGIVVHGDDLTVAVAIPSSRIASSGAIYEHIHRAIAAACGTAVRLASPDDVQVGSECFAHPALHDVLLGSKKICGGALRRTKTGVLYQGSIQGISAPAPIRLAETLCPGWKPLEISRSVLEKAARLEEEKYSTDAWNRRR
ncbi:MAG: hypothetical protein SFU53_08630 [Terrimicrobiaceae bacterium]|nr:hypothetical protein [Terrimicrobiaceae bacterium]